MTLASGTGGCCSPHPVWADPLDHSLDDHYVVYLLFELWVYKFDPDNKRQTSRVTSGVE